MKNKRFKSLKWTSNHHSNQKNILETLAGFSFVASSQYKLRKNLDSLVSFIWTWNQNKIVVVWIRNWMK